MEQRARTCGYVVGAALALAAASGCASDGPAYDGAPKSAAAATTPPDGSARRGGAELMARGTAALAAGRPGDAERSFHEATEASPRDGRTWIALARARIALGKRDEAIRDLDTSLALAETVEALALRGRQLGLARRFDEAERDLGRVVELAPADADGWAALVAVQINRGDDVEAQFAFASIVRLLGKVIGPDRVWTQLLSMPPDPAHPQESLDRCTRGRVALLQGLWIDAHAEHLNGLRYSPRFSWCTVGLAEAAWRIGGVAQAEQSLRAAIQAYPEVQAPLRADAQGKLAALLQSQRRASPETASLVRAALQVRGDRAALLDILGRACDAAGDRHCAEDAYRRLLARPHLPDSMRTNAAERLASLTTAVPGTGLR